MTMKPDINGEPARTAPHLVSFRDWLIEQMRRHPHHRFINATGAGLLTGPPIEQASLASVFADGDTIDRPLVDRVLTAAHQAARGDMGQLLEGVTALLAGADEEAITRWIEFAGGAVSYPAIELALRSPEHAAWLLGKRS